MARVKCKLCGKDIYTETAFRVVIGKRPTYFCNWQEHETWHKMAETIKNMVALSCHICGGDGFYPLLTREINQFAKDNDVYKAYDYINDQQEYIMKALSKKSFEKDYYLVRYYMAIVRNNYAEYKKKPEAPKTKYIEETYENKGHNYQRKRKPLSEFIDDYLKGSDDN